MIEKKALDKKPSNSAEEAIIAAIMGETKKIVTKADRDEESISPPSKPAHPCPNCGAALPLAAKICEACGASVFTEPTKQLCQNCWQEIPSGVAFCINCGAPIPIPEGITPLPLPPKAEGGGIEDIIEVIIAETNPIEMQPKAHPPVKEILFEKDISHSPGARSKKRDTCPRCGIVLAPGTKFCASCGMPLLPGLEEIPVEEIASERDICPFCRIIIPKGRLVCPSCGNPLEANAAVEKAGDNGGPQTGRCPFCGLKIPVSAKICPSCAAVISNTTPNTNDPAPAHPSGKDVTPPPPDTAPPPQEKQIPPPPGVKPESEKPRPFPGPAAGVRNKPPVKAAGKNAPLLSRIANEVKLSRKIRLTLFIIGALVLVSAAGFTAFQVFAPYKPKSLDAQLTQIAQTAQPIATLPAALAKDDTATQAVAEQAASPSREPSNTIQAAPTLEPEADPTIALTDECLDADGSGVCLPALGQTQGTPLASEAAFADTPSPASTEKPAPNSITPATTPANPATQVNTTAVATAAAVLPTIPASLTTQANKIDTAAMVQIPAGVFIMGSEAKSDPDYWGVEGPPHTVTLNSYWIYKTEVTNAMYQKCVDAGTCTKPSKVDSSSSFYTKPQYADYPVVQVNWEQAQTYCKWAGGSLPSEAQWEKAARGTDGRRFPWGNAQPDGKKLNLCDKNCSLKEKDDNQNDGYMNLAPVGSFPDGMSPYGLLDMAGNVWEWTADWFQAAYYKTAPTDNPTGPQEGTARTIRGGSWSDKTAAQFRTVVRQGISPMSVFDTLGFRCVVP